MESSGFQNAVCIKLFSLYRGRAEDTRTLVLPCGPRAAHVYPTGPTCPRRSAQEAPEHPRATGWIDTETTVALGLLRFLWECESGSACMLGRSLRDRAVHRVTWGR
jgi:hypothetical protein